MKKLFNWLFPSYIEGIGILTSKYCIDEHNEIIMKDDNSIMTSRPQLIRIPKMYYLRIRLLKPGFEETWGETEVTAKVYDSAQLYSKYSIKYRISRIFADKMHIKSINIHEDGSKLSFPY